MGEPTAGAASNAAPPAESASLAEAAGSPEGIAVPSKRATDGSQYSALPPVDAGDASSSRPSGEPLLDETTDASAAGGMEDLIKDNKALDRMGARRTTDLCCLVVFGLFWALVFTIVRSALHDGNPERLFHGFDYHGSLCGVDDDVLNKPLIYWPDPAAPMYPICIDRCPVNESSLVPFPIERVSSWLKHDNVTEITEIETTEEMRPTYPSILAGGIFCLPASSLEEDDDAHAPLRQRVNAADDPLLAMFKDLCCAWLVLLLVVTLSVGAGYAYFFLLKFCARVLTFGTLSLLVALLGGVAFYALGTAGAPGRDAVLWGSFGGDPAWTRHLVGWVAVGMLGALLLLLCCFFTTLQRAVGCIEASCDAMWALPHMLMMPSLEIGMKILFALQWLSLFAWVLTNGVITAPTAFVDGVPVHGLVFDFSYTAQQRCGIAIYVLSLLWGLETIHFCFQLVVGHVVAVWYFTPCRPDLSKRPVDGNVWAKALWAALRYHLGSIALAAALLSSFRLANAIFGYIARQAKGTNRAAAAIGHAFMGCVWCYEEVVRYINKNSLIEMVLRSTDFFTSAGVASRRLECALPEAAALNGITIFFQILGNVAITGIGAYAALWSVSNLDVYSDPASAWYLERPLLVVAVALLLSNLVATVCMAAFDMTSDTLLFCWLHDTDEGAAEFAPAPLRALLGPPRRGEAAGEGAKL